MLLAQYMVQHPVRSTNLLSHCLLCRVATSSRATLLILCKLHDSLLCVYIL